MSVTASQSVKALETRTDRMIANARASPPCDAQIPRLTSVETRWRGNKSRELGDGCKLLYSSSADNRGRNGVGIVLDKDMKAKVIQVNRVSDRVLSIKLELEGMDLNIVSAYAPQVGCDDDEKDAFWEEIEREISSIPSNERIFFGGDLNGHIGCGNTEITEQIRGIWGIGSLNQEGERVMDFALGTDLAILNTYFQKDENKLITYKSGNRSSQIDFILCRRQHVKEIKDCKVLSLKTVAAQHKLLAGKETNRG
ncbi:hypothetical protein M8J77_010024 [Diaphorina citri]|nr:hypothetical protein M8J77_010024 [Diaphorina citri]